MSKIELENLISLKNGNKLYELVKNPETYLGEIKIMIEIFLKYLWEIPELVAKIIINSDIMM